MLKNSVAPWENPSMLSSMAHRPLKWFRDLPCSSWKEDGYKIFVILFNHRFVFKIRCEKCNKCAKNQAFTMHGVNVQESKPCQH